MTVSWPDLRVGDWIRLVQLPAESSQPGYTLHEDTLRLYRHLIERRVMLTVELIDESGLPWVEYIWEADDRTEESHALAVNHDGLERVDEDA